MIVVTTERNASHQEADNTTSVTVTSPLTSTTSKESTRPCTPRPRKKSRRSPRQASEARLDAKEVRDDLRKRYSSAFKEATMLLSSSGIHNETADQLIKRLNSQYCLLNESKKLAKSTLYRAVAKGNVGNSPLKKGPLSRIPMALMEVVVAHTEVSQVGNGELRGQEIKRLIGAAVLGTPFHDTFTVESAWRKVRLEFPDKLQAVKNVC